MILFDLCKKIGILTLGDLSRFKKEECIPGENILDGLMRYYLSIGGSNFKIKKIGVQND